MAVYAADRMFDPFPQLAEGVLSNSAIPISLHRRGLSAVLQE